MMAHSNYNMDFLAKSALQMSDKKKHHIQEMD